MSDKKEFKFELASNMFTQEGADGFPDKFWQHTPAVPWDPNVGVYASPLTPKFMAPLEFTAWQEETMSWKEGCYIGACLLQNATVRIIGPDAIQFLADTTINSHSKFPIGSIKHVAMTLDNGKVLCHGMTMRIAEEEVWTYSLAPYMYYMLEKRSKELDRTYDIKFVDLTAKEYDFQVAGPRILEVLENAAEEDLHDIGFLRHRTATIAGKEVRIMRFGMGGTLAYEVHGPMEDARTVYTKIMEVGKEYGIKRLGWISYSCNHPENGFPQNNYTFQGAGAQDPGYRRFIAETMGLDPSSSALPFDATLLGSAADDPTKYLRDPVENNWDRSINFDHDFPGKAIIQELMEHPKRKTVTLVWNPEDILDVYASLFQKDEPVYEIMELPITNMWRQNKLAIVTDDVFNMAGELIGQSSARTYGLYSRDMFSLGCIDVDYIEEGTRVQVLWGQPGKRQKLVRATVGKFPHLSNSMPMNIDFDIDSIPHYKA